MPETDTSYTDYTREQLLVPAPNVDAAFVCRPSFHAEVAVWLDRGRLGAAALDRNAYQADETPELAGASIHNVKRHSGADAPETLSAIEADEPEARGGIVLDGMSVEAIGPGRQPKWRHDIVQLEPRIRRTVVAMLEAAWRRHVLGMAGNDALACALGMVRGYAPGGLAHQTLYLPGTGGLQVAAVCGQIVSPDLAEDAGFRVDVGDERAALEAARAAPIVDLRATRFYAPVSSRADNAWGEMWRSADDKAIVVRDPSECGEIDDVLAVCGSVDEAVEVMARTA